jgi:hypothetical protein
MARALELPDDSHDQQLGVSGIDNPSYNLALDYGAIHTQDYSTLDFAFGPSAGAGSDANDNGYQNDA